MNDADRDELLKRLQALEAEVARLRNPPPSAALPSVAVPPPLPAPPPLPPTANPAVAAALERARTLLSLENLLSKAGVVLLVLGMLLLFKYSIDQGWFTPVVRVGIGLAAAAALAVAGWRLLGPRPVLGQSLLGGGMAVFYGTVCAAVQLYSLVGPAAGLLAVLVATVAGFTIALRRNVQVPAVIGLAGGLAAPFLLDSGGLAVVPVVVYSLLILAAAAIAYQRKGWRSMYWTALGCGALVFLALGPEISTVRSARLADQFALQMAWLAWTAAFALLPAQRALRGGGDGAGAAAILHAAAFLVPALAVGGTISTWSLEKAASGWVCLGAALLYALGSRLLAALPAHRRSHRLAAALLGVTGLLLVLDGDAAFFVAVALVIGLAEAVRRTREPLLEAGLHLAALVMGAWWIVRMAEGASSPPLLRLDAVVLLAGVAALFWAWRCLAASPARWAYWLAGVPFLMGWIAREAGTTGEGMAWTSAGWGALAVGLLAVSVARWDALLRRTGLVVLAVVLGKLLLVDMAAVAAIWRILLFIGMGGLLLLASYLLPRLDPENRHPAAPKPAEPPPLPPPQQ